MRTRRGVAANANDASCYNILVATRFETQEMSPVLETGFSRCLLAVYPRANPRKVTQIPVRYTLVEPVLNGDNLRMHLF